ERRMPPVLHVALGELVRGAAQQVLAHARRICEQHRHRILQLVAEAKGATGLVVAAAPPETAGDGLVEQPAVRQHVERRIGRAHRRLRLPAAASLSTSKKATRPGNSMLKWLRASSAPVFASASVTTCIACFWRRSPSTHST